MTLDTVMGAFVWLLGLCVGSFLNVVVYRLPAGLSVNKPRRSFCPQCGGSIAWRDNIPVLSWLLLGARCRKCGVSISVQYPLVEAITGLSFVLVYYMLFVSGARDGVGEMTHPGDWPLLGVWLVLIAALVACAAMDIVSYMVDVRTTYVAVAAGVLLYAAWPRAAFLTQHAAMPIAAGAVAAFLASVVMLWLTVWRTEDEELEPEQAETPAAAPSPSAVGAGRLAIAVLVGLTVWLLAETVAHGLPGRDITRLTLPDTIEVNDATARTRYPGIAPDVVVPASLLAIFATTVLVGGQRREADEQVTAAIEEEQPHARREVLRELGWLSPIIAAGVAAYLAVAYWPAGEAAWHAIVEWSPGGGFCPVGGVTFAACGAMAGAAAGWVLRVVFTLVFGREAMGVGDIYILAAAGAAGGWDIALLGLLFGVGVALAAYLLSLLLKRSVIIPFGPWLAIGFVTALWLSKPAADMARYYLTELTRTWELRPDICLIACGLMAVGSAAAVVLARLVRRLVEPAAK